MTWPTFARAFAEAGGTLTPYGESLLPRVLVSPESASEHIRNALAILCALPVDTPVPALEAAAVKCRLWQALKNLETK